MGQYSTEYAGKLEQFAQELVSNIAENRPELLLIMDLPASWDIRYTVFVDAHSSLPVGCLRFDLNGNFE